MQETKEGNANQENKIQPQSELISPSNQNLNAALTYLVGWITGLIFLLTEKHNDYVRFHAAQSLIIFGFFNVLAFVPLFGWVTSLILGPVALVLWVLLMVKAYQGERFKLPVAGEYAEKLKEQIGK